MKILTKTTIPVLFIITIFSACNRKTISTKDLVKYIVEKDISDLDKYVDKSNVNTIDSSGISLLNYAVRTKSDTIVSYLLDKGANPNLQNKDEYYSTPLMECSNYNLVDVAKLLIEKGADVNIQDKYGDPVINWTAYYGEKGYTQLLLNNQAKTDLKSSHSDGVMQVALKEWQYEIVDLLLDNNITLYDTLPHSGRLIQAVKQGQVAQLKLFADPSICDIKDAAGNSLLMLAAINGNMEIVKYLLNNKAIINELNPAGHTALNLAVYFKNNDIARLLIKRGADVNLTDKRFKLTPLIAAIRSNNLEMGLILMENKANINNADGINNFSPLMWAVLYQNKDFLKLLLKYEPDLSVVSQYGTTVFDLTKDERIIELLKQYKN